MGQITKQIKGKIIFKHETEADWKLSSYVPDEGEQIIYDPDAFHSNPRIKIGDGKKVADALPFTTAEIPTKISEFENDVGYLKTETDPTVPAWAKAATKPSYTAAEVGALPSNTKVPTKVSELTNDKGYLTEHQSLEGLATEAYVNEKIGAISTPDVSGQIGEHNVSRSAHNDIRGQISQLSSEKVAKSNIFLGIASDGLMYIFVDGEPVGSGVARGGGDDIFGYVDENNVVVLSGNLPTGAYTIKYEMTDGSLVHIGNLALDNNVYYTVQNILTNCTTNNSTLRVIEGQSYSATITAKDGYKLSSVTVTMGGLPVSVSGGIINISNVTGNIVIDAVAKEKVANHTITNKLVACTTSNESIEAEHNTGYTATITPDTQYNLSAVYVTMGGVDISASAVSGSTVNIASVTGDVVVSCVGYKTATRLSTSGGEKTQANHETTGFIPCTYNDVIYVNNTTITNATTEVVCFYRADQSLVIGTHTKYALGTTSGEVISSKVSDIALDALQVNKDSIAFVRISANEINANSIITVNQPLS